MMLLHIQLLLALMSLLIMSTQGEGPWIFAQEPEFFLDPDPGDPIVKNGADQERFDRLRSVEIQHGRVAMLAFFGQIVTRAGIHLPGDIFFSSSEGPLLKMTGGFSPAPDGIVINILKWNIEEEWWEEYEKVQSVNGLATVAGLADGYYRAWLDTDPNADMKGSGADPKVLAAVGPTYFDVVISPENQIASVNFFFAEGSTPGKKKNEGKKKRVGKKKRGGKRVRGLRH